MTPDQIAALPYRRNVGVMVLARDGRVWAGRRIDNPDDAWQMPQGGIDTGEEPRAAALRELTEETSIPASAVEVLAETSGWIAYDLPHDLVPRLWKGRYRGQEQKWFLMQFAGPDDLISIETEDPEFSHWTWMDIDTLLAKIVPFKRHVYQEVCDAFAPYLEPTA